MKRIKGFFVFIGMEFSFVLVRHEHSLKEHYRVHETLKYIESDSIIKGVKL